MDPLILIKTVLVPGMVERGELKVENPIENVKTEIDLVEVKPLDSNGTFSLTVPYKVTVQLSQGDDKKNETTFHLVAKVTPPVAEEMYAGCQFDTLFENEMNAYTKIIPILGSTELYPKYYYSHRKHLEAVMVLDDFSKQGWRMAPRMFNLQLDYILLAVKELGRFHGECYGLKEVNREVFDSITSKFMESRYAVDVVDPIWDLVTANGPLRATKSMRESESMDQVSEDFLQKMEVALAEPFKFGRKCVIPQEPLAIICHGDYLRNNIAYKYDDEDPDHPTDVMMFDFQTLRYASPMIDFSVFLANSTGYDVRLQHFDEIFKTYHDELIKSLCKVSKFTPNEIPEYYSYNSFLKELAQYYPFGFSIASSFLVMLHDPMEVSFPLTEEIVQEAFVRGGEAVNKELRGMLIEMYNLRKKFGIEF